MHRKLFWLLTVFILGSALAVPAPAAETSQTMAFTGCNDSLTGPVDVRLRLFTASSGGTMVFEETQTGVDGSSGCISVQIGAATVDGIPPNVFASNRSLWVGFAYAFKAVNADSAINAGSAGLAGGLLAGAVAQGNLSVNGKVGIGTTNPGAALHIVGANPTTGFGLRIDQASPNGDGLLAYVNTTSDTRTVFSAGSNVVGLNVKGNGYVGIGTTTPLGRLHVAGNGASAVIGDPNCGPGSNTVAIGFLSGVGLDCANNFNFGASTTLKETVINRPTGGPISFREGNGPAQMYIRRGGDVGIGTTTPGGKLHVENNRANAVAVRGVAGTDGLGVYGIAVVGTGVSGIGSTAGVEGQVFRPQNPGVWARSYRDLSDQLGLRVEGRMTATGTKSAAMPLRGQEHVLLYAEESTEVWFSDYGSVQLVNGLATVHIDPEFLQTVNTSKDYHVFLTARGNPNGALYIDSETPSSFEIRETTGTANIKVSYRIVAKRKDFAEERMKKIALPSIESSRRP